MRCGIIASAAIALSLIFISFEVSAADKTPDDLVREARSAIREVSVVEVGKMLESHERVIILDVRDREEYETGYIPGALNISRGMLEFKVNLLIPDKNARIIVYCGVDLRGPLAVKTLNDMGYRNAVNMSGGLKSWKESGYPIQK